MEPNPRISIGLPIFNGEKFVAEAIESIRAQTCSDWELVISDNGSSDGSEEICRGFAALDPRVRYYREPRNRGAAWNFNRAFALARGKYFSWLAHDDLVAPGFLEATSRALDEHPDAVLSMPRVGVINESGMQILGEGAEGSRAATGQLLTDAGFVHRRELLESERPHERFLAVLAHSQRCYELFALMRADALRKTPQMRSYPNAEKVLLAELALLGKYHEVPEVLFYSRWHTDRLTNGDPGQKRQEHWKPRSKSRIVFPHQPRCALGYFLLLWQHRLKARDRIACLGSFVQFLFQVRRYGSILRGAMSGTGMHVSIPDNCPLGPRPSELPPRQPSPTDSNGPPSEVRRHGVLA